MIRLTHLSLNSLFPLCFVLGYVKIFNHDVSGGLFTTNDDVGRKNSGDPDNKLFSILDQLEDYRNSEGKFHFKLCYPELTWGRDGKTCNEWIQSSNPYTDTTITGFEEIFLAFDLESWKGLGKNSNSNSNAFIDDSPSHGNWFTAIGAKSYWGGSDTIPGPRHPTDSAANSPISIVKLYVKGKLPRKRLIWYSISI